MWKLRPHAQRRNLQHCETMRPPPPRTFNQLPFAPAAAPGYRPNSPPPSRQRRKNQTRDWLQGDA
eukprot:5080322-Prymnesium_polylepis.1